MTNKKTHYKIGWFNSTVREIETKKKLLEYEENNVNIQDIGWGIHTLQWIEGGYK